jgi:hypothetical protein
MHLIDSRGDQWTILRTGDSLVRDVDRNACLLIRERGTRPVYIVLEHDEFYRDVEQPDVGIIGPWHEMSIAGIPVKIERRRSFPWQERFLQSQEDLHLSFPSLFRSAQEQEQALLEARRINQQRRLNEAIQFYRSISSEQFYRSISSELDAVYARHGGTQTPPSQRLPSRLHPLVMQDEADRKAVADAE